MAAKDSVEEAFNRAASDYDAWVRQAIPAYDELFRVAVELIRFPKDHPLEIADLGAGTGLFTAHVLAAFPNAVATLYDAAGGMLAVARDRFESASGRVAIVEQRIEAFAETARFDLVIGRYLLASTRR